MNINIANERPTLLLKFERLNPTNIQRNVLSHQQEFIQKHSKMLAQKMK